MNEELGEIGRQVALMAEAFGKRFNNQMAEMCKQIEAQKAGIIVAAEAAILPLAQQIESFKNISIPVLDSLAKSMELLPPKNRAALMTLANNGWYLDPDLSIPAIFRVAEIFTPGDNTEANEAMCEYFDGRADEIELRLTEQLPKRARIIAAAFNAHRRGEYALSIPVFLSQADGICYELTDVELYGRIRNSNLPKLSSRPILTEVSPFSLSMLAPIIEFAPISATKKERGPEFDGLNRNAVLHGESTDYDNRINSCRAISLLLYVSWILSSKGVVKEAT